MIAAVVPACNEEQTIGGVLDQLARLEQLDCVIPVLNGCTDRTRARAMAHPLAARFALIEYPLPLGVDVPRSWGARCALQLGADAVLFVDGDMEGELADCLQTLVRETLRGCDLALTNCYPYIGYRSETAKAVLYHREQLNRRLGLLDSIGIATPSHGPHCVSGKLLRTVGTDCFAVPPLMLAKAAEAGLVVRVAARLETGQWSSRQRGDAHNQRIADTIIGDCIAARQYICRQPVTREENGVRYLGYRDGAATGREAWARDDAIKARD